jgi:hypothetical protein
VAYFTSLSVARLITLNRRRDELEGILEGKNLGLIKAISRNLPGETKEN